MGRGPCIMEFLAFSKMARNSMARKIACTSGRGGRGGDEYDVVCGHVGEIVDIALEPLVLLFRVGLSPVVLVEVVRGGFGAIRATSRPVRADWAALDLVALGFATLALEDVGRISV